MFSAECPDFVMDSAETDNQEETVLRADKETPNTSEEVNNLLELDEEPELIESKSFLLCFINHNIYNCQLFCISYTETVIYCDRIAVLGAPRCAAAVEPL